MKRFFLSRITVICLTLAALSAITLSAFFPQSFITPPQDMIEWQAAHPLLHRWTDFLGLHRIYTHPAFALILAGVMMSLLLSTWNQCITAWRRTFQRNQPGPAGDQFDTPAPLAEISYHLIKRGYIRINETEGCLLMVRHPWGYWGLALFHLGMLAVIAASLLIALTQQRGIISISQGFIHEIEEPLLMEEHGMLAAPLKLTEPIQMDRVTWSFRPENHGVRSVVSQLTFLSDKGVAKTETVEINRILRHHGIQYYQALKFGHAFFLEITDQAGRAEKTQLQLQHPVTPHKASYDTFGGILPDGNVLRVKYVVNGEMKSFDPVDPLLTLRIDQHGREIGRLSLKRGDEGTIGPFRFRLHGFAPWSQLIAVRMTGMPGVFLGFAIICLGGLLHYFTPPREIAVRKNPAGGHTVGWRGIRFAGFYRDEYEQLKQALTHHNIEA